MCVFSSCARCVSMWVAAFRAGITSCRSVATSTLSLSLSLSWRRLTGPNLRRSADRGHGRYSRPLLALAALVAVALAGCGESTSTGSGIATVTNTSLPAAPTAGLPEGAPIVTVAGAPSITKAELEHWVSVTDGFEASGAKVNGRSIPKPPVPQPPDYKACIAGIHRSFGGSAKAQCEREYVQLERKALSYLITTDWIRGEAARRHLSVSHSEVAAHLHSELKGKYRPGSSQFKSMISYTGESMGDLAQRTEGELLKDKIAQTLLAHKARTTEASLLLISFQESFQARWKPRTSCRPGYVIEDCSQFTAQSLAAPGQKQTTTYRGRVRRKDRSRKGSRSKRQEASPRRKDHE